MAMVLAVTVLVLGAALFWLTRRGVRDINKATPPIGTLARIDGLDVHYIDIAPADTPPVATVVFLHGASGNLRDPHMVFAGKMPTNFRHVYIDRPGHGWSSREKRDLATPVEQAEHLMKVLDYLEIDEAIFVGHSWSGALALSIALEFPKRVRGLVLNSPVSHPWPGGINWYYHVGAWPLIGPLFVNTFALPFGLSRVECAADKVFWPEAVPDYYDTEIGPRMVLDPKRFRPNAQDIAFLRPEVVRMAARYHEIKAPVHVITGARDQIVFPWVHTKGLDRAIAHSKITLLPEGGHMPHHAHAILFIEAMVAIAEETVDADKGDAGKAAA